MTARSTRREAEMMLINAAVGYTSGVGATTYNELVRAVQAYEALGLAEVGQPAFSNNSTDTSAEAGASMRNLTGDLSLRCYDEIFISWHHGAIGLTVDQLEIQLSRSHQSVSARVNELRDKGWVRDSGQRRKTRSGRKAIVWTPTEQAKRRR